jgi:hypothetical protein
MFTAADLHTRLMHSEFSHHVLTASCLLPPDTGNIAVKKEKRARNEQMARQHRKAETPMRGGGRGGYRAAAQRENDADSEWLTQIFGQHTIFRKDQVAHVSSAGSRQVCIRPLHVSHIKFHDCHAHVRQIGWQL